MPTKDGKLHRLRRPGQPEAVHEEICQRFGITTAGLHRSEVVIENKIAKTLSCHRKCMHCGAISYDTECGHWATPLLHRAWITGTGIPGHGTGSQQWACLTKLVERGIDESEDAPRRSKEIG